MSDVYAEFLKYRDEFGFNSTQTYGEIGKNTQNGSLFTVEYLICLLKSDSVALQIKLDEVYRIQEVLARSCSAPGLSLRFPGSGEYDSMDNNTALLVFSALWGKSEYAKAMLEHSKTLVCTGADQTQDPTRNNKFYPLAKFLGFGKARNFFNNQHPDKFCFPGWYGRSPGFMGLLDICATGNTSLFRWCGVLVGQFINAWSDPNNTDGRKLPYVTWQLLARRNKFLGFLYKIWCRQLVKVYPNGMQDVYSKYYGNSEHPIVKHSSKY